MTRRRKLGIVDYGVGNINSLASVLKNLGTDVKLVKTRSELESVGMLVLPGAGAAAFAMHELKKSGLDNVIKKQYGRGAVKLIGICLGMQLFFEHSEEGDTECLGLLSGQVLEFPDRDCHVGWNAVYPANGDLSFKTEAYYFNHSYYVQSKNEYVTGEAKENIVIPAIIESESLIGFQFHPEKSQRVGKRLLHKAIFGTS